MLSSQKCVHYKNLSVSIQLVSRPRVNPFAWVRILITPCVYIIYKYIYISRGWGNGTGFEHVEHLHSFPPAVGGGGTDNCLGLSPNLYEQYIFDAGYPPRLLHGVWSSIR